MSKYLNNFSDYDCSPISILNAFIWLGMPKTVASSLYKLVYDVCKTDEDGTYTTDFYKALKKLVNCNIQRRKKATLEEIRDHLSHGGSIILSHIDFTGDWHHSLWHSATVSGKFFGANIFYNSDKPCVTARTFKKYITKGRDGKTPTFYFLRK